MTKWISVVLGLVALVVALLPQPRPAAAAPPAATCPVAGPVSG